MSVICNCYTVEDEMQARYDTGYNCKCHVGSILQKQKNVLQYMIKTIFTQLFLSN